ncbi:serine hydrolase domain-containing protein [Aeromicrobium endophyticum]|uniref:Class A beta-lactamase-related serine hydrolase n=1 Tax=Aeromicrobium endophyticum TaxID=2292704 RepID=A0A371P4U2_9ACTN|nr:serine hydrolase domain-containing protein [Aeromicrobium endophyticum]REK70963.1 class A beta-lactamase-related serine hydrolase [Aeromicrobium endophyticum]
MSDESTAVPIETMIDALFEQYVGVGTSRAAVVGLSDETGLSHWRGHGSANDQDELPDADMLFPIASMTKSFACCATLVARDAGLLDLEDPITKHVPEFQLAANDSGEIVPTIRMLLSMSGGLTEDNAWVDPFIDAPVDRVLHEAARGVRLSSRPGTTYEYSNLGYALVGIAVGRAVGMPFADYVQQNLLEPLGLTSTFYDKDAPADRPRASGYSLDDRGDWIAYGPRTSDAFLAAGGLVSTIRDLATWITWLGSALRESPTDESVLSTASRRELHRIHVMTPPAVTIAPDGGLAVVTGGYGLGVQVRQDLRRGLIVGHAGGLPGFTLYMTWHPASGRGLVALTNSHRGDLVAMCDRALGMVLADHDVPASVVRLWPETHELRHQTDALIRRWDDALAVRIFADNVDFDQPLDERRAEIARLVEIVGPLLDAPGASRLVSADSPADVTWSMAGERGELLCMIHLTPVEPAAVQELVVRAVPDGHPRPVELQPDRFTAGPSYTTTHRIIATT